MDWCNKDDVIRYATELRRAGIVVIKHPDRDNYNIVHDSRTDLYKPEWVVWRVIQLRRDIK